MKLIKYIALTLVIIGGLNWGLIGLFNFNLVTFLFGVDSLLTELVYILVGICSIVSLSLYMCISNETIE